MIGMRLPLPVDRLVLDLLQVSKEASSCRELVARSGDYLKIKLGAEEVIVKEASNSSFAAADEVALNTGKPYVDNSLSGYSAFADLIQYNNRGFRCCVVIPILKDTKRFGTVTLLSKDDGGFSQEDVGLVTLASTIISSEASAKYERDKSLNIAKYFDASFNNMMPQFLVDSELGIVKANKSAMNYFDRSQKELSKAKLSDIFEISNESIERLRKGAIIESFGKLYQSRIFEISPSRINESLVHLMVNEISEVKEAEGKLKMLDSSEDEAFIVMGKDFDISWISGSSSSMFGMEPKVLVGRKFTDFVSSPSAIKELLQGMSNNRYSGKVKLNFGTEFELYGNMVVYRDGDDFYCTVSRDYERYVKISERMSEDIIELSNDPMIVVNGTGYIMSFNKAAESLFGLDKDAVGTQIYALCADSESQNKIVASLSIAKSNGYIGDVYANMLDSRDKSEIPCVQTIKALLDKKGNASTFLIMNKELLTKNKIDELESDKESAERDVEKLKTESDLKSQFIYNISHDLKTPITNIMGFSKLLLTDDAGTLTKEQKDYIQIIYDESERFLQLVKQILDVAKLSSGMVNLDQQQVNFKDIGNNPSIKALEEACRNKGLEFSWIVDYDVPVITADPNRLIQLFSNLIGNAIKFTEKGSIKVRVSRRKGGVYVQVADTGIGIAKEDKPKIFKKFYQLRRGLIKQEGSGTGLGLSIAKEIVSLHGGRIDVDSEIGKGSTFWFTLPMKPKIKKKTLKYNKAEHQTP